MTAESLAIDGWQSETPAWTILDYTPLKEPAAKRGADRVLPGVTGVKGYPRRYTVTEKQLPMHIFGDTAPNGSLYPDGQDGLQDNIDAIVAAIVDPPSTADGTRSATWTLPDGTTRTAHVHVIEFPLTRLSPVMARAVLTISIPAGRFT